MWFCVFTGHVFFFGVSSLAESYRSCAEEPRFQNPSSHHLSSCTCEWQGLAFGSLLDCFYQKHLSKLKALLLLQNAPAESGHGGTAMAPSFYFHSGTVDGHPSSRLAQVTAASWLWLHHGWPVPILSFLLWMLNLGMPSSQWARTSPTQHEFSRAPQVDANPPILTKNGPILHDLEGFCGGGIRLLSNTRACRYFPLWVLLFTLLLVFFTFQIFKCRSNLSNFPLVFYFSFVSS